MMTDSHTSEESDIQQLVPRGPGEVFKQARERARISLDEISQFLYLPRDVIEALESDQQDLLPEPTYVKGYIRSYARYLELDPEPLIESYIKYVYVPPAPPLQAPKPNKAQRSKARRGPLDIILIAFLSCVFVFLSVWWFYPQPTKFIGEIGSMVSGLLGDAGESIHSSATQAIIPEQSVLGHSSQFEPQSLALPAEAMSNTIDVPAKKKVAQVGTEPSTPVLSRSSPQIEGSDETNEPAANETTVGSVVASDASDGFELQGRVAPGGDRIILTFNDHSWTEVYDANKERLLFGLVNSGSVKELQGKAPFRILLGNSSAVTIEFNGEPYDHSEFERFDKTARFLVKNSAEN